MLYGDATLACLPLDLFVLTILNMNQVVPALVNSALHKLVNCNFILEYKAADAPIKEDARQKIIYNKYYDRYLAYMQAFRKNCLKSFQTQFFAEDCANSQMIALGIDYEKVHE